MTVGGVDWEYVRTVYTEGGESIRGTYSVPSEVGMRVKAYRKPATIVGFRGQYLVLLLDGDKHPNYSTWHPTWRMEYPTTTEGVMPVTDTRPG